jgi:TetR/AcrR family transcriptional regulator, transcriptional repressor for nem operon
MLVDKRTRPAPRPARPAASQRILDVAEQLAQTRGFNGFSYGDIADQLLVTKASLHYHFPSKAELGRALIARYRVAFGEALEAIYLGTQSGPQRLRKYASLYDSVMRNNRMCLCGMLAAEYETLPGAMQGELREFFDANERWLAAVLEDGRRAGDLSFRGNAKVRARVVLGALEGAMLVARTYADGRRFREAAKQVPAELAS